MDNQPLHHSSEARMRSFAYAHNEPINMNFGVTSPSIKSKNNHPMMISELQASNSDFMPHGGDSVLESNNYTTEEQKLKDQWELMQVQQRSMMQKKQKKRLFQNVGGSKTMSKNSSNYI